MQSGIRRKVQKHNSLHEMKSVAQLDPYGTTARSTIHEVGSFREEVHREIQGQFCTLKIYLHKFGYRLCAITMNNVLKYNRHGPK